MENKNPIYAVIWDYDGTLVNSFQKNLNVTKKILADILEKPSDNFSSLQSVKEYQKSQLNTPNWREYYKSAFGLTESQVTTAGKMWTEYQLEDNTTVPFYKGITDVIRALDHYKQGIVSQNSKKNIEQTLDKHGLLNCFDSIIGHEEVASDKQKPDPFGLLKCISELGIPDKGYVFYIGDHITDFQCATNTNVVLSLEKPGLKVITIGAFYDNNHTEQYLTNKPDFKVHRTKDFLHVIKSFNEKQKK